MIASDQLDVLKKVFQSRGMQVWDVSRLTGGCINDCFKLATDKGLYFAKINSLGDMLHKEARGLELLRSAGAVHVPEIIFSLDEGSHSVLVLEFVEAGPRGKRFWENFGENLAALHKTTSTSFGLSFDNYIGSLPQENTTESDWIRFFIHHRLEPQLAIASNSGKIDSRVRQDFDSLYRRLPELLAPGTPALLHGDLWSGNYLLNQSGEATIMDPAIYFGCNEVDLAMSKLFGGFDQAFYDAYLAAWPVDPGLESRLDIYNLYPLLVHVNLFGGSYLSSVKSILKRFV